VTAAGDARFFRRSGPFPLREVAAAAGGDAPAQDLLLTGVAPLQAAEPGEVSFLDNRKYVPALEATRAGAVIVHPAMARHVPAGTVAIVTEEPYLGWARVAEIGPLAVIEAGAEVGPRCRIGPAAVIGAGVVLGPDCRIGAHASLSHALLGARVVIYPGARIGQEGFGFAAGPAGFVTVPQLGRVVIEDDVEVGANTTIDRGSAHDTVIGAGSRLDNLVQIGHNVRLGRCCVIVAQAGISGSTVLEDFVQVAGQAGLTGHLHIGHKARIGAQGGVMADVPAGADVVGSPAQPVREFFRQVVTLRRLAARSRLSGHDEAGTATAANKTSD
jgi:UDP-3-O-[3-hydroxymyristoyl] glucosamine N-acyltransferase